MTESRHLLFQMLDELGIGCLFGAEGAAELPLLDGCAAFPSVKYIQVLHENIALGAAMGYARTTGKPGVAAIRVAPSMAHVLDNLYSAWQARIPLVVIGRQPGSRLATQEPIPASSAVEMARQFSKWSHELRHAYDLPLALQRAFKEALAAPMGPVFLALPADLAFLPADLAAYPVTRVGQRMCGDMDVIEQAADLLAMAERPAIVAGDGCGLSGAWAELVQLASLIGAPVYSQALSTLMNYPPSDLHWQNELPERAADMRQALGQHDTLLLCGCASPSPVAALDGGPPIPDSVTTICLHNDPAEIGESCYSAAAIQGDIRTSLRPLLAAIAASPHFEPAAAAGRNRALAHAHDVRLESWERYLAHARGANSIAPALVAAELAKLRPKDLIYVDEANSATRAFLRLLAYEDPLSYYGGHGAAPGCSLPAALGIKLAAPHRTVVSVAGDAAALRNPQVYWAAARLNLPILFIVLNNREYNSPKQGPEAIHTLRHASSESAGLNSAGLDFDFPAIAAAFGIAGERVADPHHVRAALARGLGMHKPYLLEFVVDGHDHTWPAG